MVVIFNFLLFEHIKNSHLCCDMKKKGPKFYAIFNEKKYELHDFRWSDQFFA